MSQTCLILEITGTIGKFDNKERGGGCKTQRERVSSANASRCCCAGGIRDASVGRNERPQ